MTDSNHSPVLGPVILGGLGAYFIGAPLASWLTGNWWWMLIGLGLFLGLFCFLFAIALYLESRKPNAPKPILDQLAQAVVQQSIEQENQRLRSLPRQRVIRKGEESP